MTISAFPTSVIFFPQNNQDVCKSFTFVLGVKKFYESNQLSTMSYFQKNEFLSADSFIHIYSGISKEGLDEMIFSAFITSGYRLVVGEKGNGTYERGNRTMRLLFGAFSKYFRFQVMTYVDGSNYKVQVIKESSGMSGGMIGMDQVKKELTRLSLVLQSI